MISGTFTGAPALVSEIRAAKPALQRTLETKITRLTAMLLIDVKGKLSDDVLHVRTGRLRRSINMRIEASGDKVTGTVGTNVGYGRVHEYGGIVTVREHMRMMTQAFGRPVKDPRMINVRAHEANYPQRSFLRSALADMAGAIEAEFS